MATGQAVADPTPEELAVARDLFEAAQAAQSADDWQRCEESVSEAVAIIETPGLRFHLAFCKERQGRWVEALVDYKRASELVLSGVNAPDVEEMLRPAVERLERELPKLTLRMEDVPEGATLFLDGQERSTRLIGKSIPVDPGGRRVNVTAPGYLPFSQHINLLSKERRTLSIKLVPKTRDEAPTGSSHETNATGVKDAAARSADATSAKTWVLLAEGAVSLGGLVLGVVEISEHSKSERNRDKLLEEIGAGNCAPSAPVRHPSCERLANANQNLELLETLSTVGIVTAGVGVVALVTTWLVWDDSHAGTAGKFGASGSTSDMKPRVRDSIRVDVLQIEGGALGSLSGRF